MAGSIYITERQFEDLLRVLNLDYSREQKDDLLSRAVGDLEGDLCERYVVPLQADGGGAFSTAPPYGQAKVLNALKAKIRQLVGTDHNRNLVIDSTQRYIDTHKIEYNDNIKSLLNAKRIYGFQLNDQAQGAVVPIQEVGIARANNRTRVRIDDDVIF